MLKLAMMIGLMSVSLLAQADDSRRYLPLTGSDKPYYADMASIRPHPDNANLIMVNTVSNMPKEGKSVVDLQHINCHAGVLIRNPNAMIEVYDKPYGQGKRLFGIPSESEKITLSDKVTPLNMFSALACHKMGSPLLDNPNILNEMVEKLQQMTAK